MPLAGDLPSNSLSQPLPFPSDESNPETEQPFPETAPSGGGLGFLLFLLLNAVLLIRPAEIFSWMESWSVYEVVILACFLVSIPSILQRFGMGPTAVRPIHWCVLGMFVAIVASQLTHLQFGLAYEFGYEFAKVLVYCVLLVSLVTSFGRVRVFLFWLVACVVVLAALALLHFHGVVNIPALEALEVPQFDDDLGEFVVIRRLCSTGLFNDPNDLCLILLVGMAFSLYWLEEREFGPARLLALAPLGLFGYALALTKSRGGFIALLAGLIALLVHRFGWRKTIPLLVVVLPLMVYLFGGRQTS